MEKIGLRKSCIISEREQCQIKAEDSIPSRRRRKTTTLQDRQIEKLTR
jgi:hypothetical protein